MRNGSTPPAEGGGWHAVPDESATATRDHSTGAVAIPLRLHRPDAPAAPITLRLDAIRAELLHARLSRLLQGEPPLEPFRQDEPGNGVTRSRRDQLDL